MHILHQTPVKVFYKWTILLCVCVAVTVPTPGDNTQRLVDDFKMKLHRKLEELRVLKTSSVLTAIKHVPSVSANVLECEGELLNTGAVVRKNNHTDLVFTVNFDNILTRLEYSKFNFIGSFPPQRFFNSLQGFVYDDKTWLVAYHTNNRSKHFLKFYSYRSSALTRDDYKQKISLSGPSLISTLNFGSKVYLGVASNNALLSEFRLYQWTGTQFDDIFSTEFKVNCMGLEVFQIYGKIYIAMSFSGWKMTAIKKFYEYSAELQTIQSWDTEAHVIKHFEDVEDHYLICGSRYWVSIHRWLGLIFTKQQKLIYNKEVLDVASCKLGGKMLVVVVFSNEIQFLLKGTSSHFVKAGNLASPTQNLKGAVIFREDSSTYLLPIHKIKALEPNVPQVMYDLSLQYQVAALETDTRLEECLDTLDKKLDARKEKIDEISPVLDNLLLPTTQLQNKTFNVNGSIKSLGNATVQSVRLQLKLPSITETKKLTKKLVKAVRKMKAYVPRLVRKSRNEKLRGNFTFSRVKVNTDFNLSLTSHLILNNISTERLLFALKTKGDQVFLSDVSVGDVKCKAVTTDFLNEKEIEDLVLTNGPPQRLTGHVMFGNISAANIFVKSGKLNDLNLIDFVLVTKWQKINDTKKFIDMKSGSINTEDGEINLRGIENVVFVDSELINSTLFFMTNLTILGNVNVTTLNKQPFSLLWSKSVKRANPQSIHGIITFRSMIINNTLSVSGFTNNSTNMTNLMTLNTDQTIPGNITFLNMVQLGNLETDRINGIQLNSEAIGRYQIGTIVVSGRKTFTTTFNVFNITLKDEVKIDYVDPSDEFPYIVTKDYGYSNSSSLILNVPIEIGNVFVNNDMEVTESGDLPLLELLDNVWLNTTEQNVDSLTVQNVSFYDMQVTSVNSIAMDDIVTVAGSELISSPKNFTDLISFETLDVNEWKTVNFTELWKPDLTVKISGNVTLEDPVIDGDLEVIETINGLEGFMHAENFQIMNGELKFDEIHLQDFVGAELDIKYVNNSDFLDFLKHAVVKSNVVPIYNKHFKHLQGKEFVSNGSLNGVYLDNIVTINTEQKVSADIEFTSVTFNALIVKEFLDSIRLDEIIYVDRIGEVSNKVFKGKVNTSHVDAGIINGINITELNMFAAKKHGANVFEQKITFKPYIQAEHIQVNKSFALDSVKFEDIVLLKRTELLKEFKGNTVGALNINVTGLVNGCDLTSVLQNALFSVKDSQTVSARKTHVGSLVVHGNIYSEQINGVYIQDIVAYLNKSSDFDLDSELIFERMIVDYVQLQDTLNGIRIEDLMLDTVRISVPQDIYGKKRFEKNLDASNITLKMLVVEKLCDMDVTELLVNSVTIFDANRTISVKVLQNIVSKNVFLKGELNEVKLPDDVVLANKSEFITSETIFNNTLNISAGLEVIGNIDGVFLLKFLKERMTRNSSQNASAILVFTEDVSIKDLKINGHINTIKMDSVVRLRGDMTVVGNVNFTAELLTENNVDVVSGTVNGAVVDNSWLQVHQNGTIESTVLFSKINVSSLVCSTVYDVDLTNLYNSTHELAHSANDKLDELTGNIIAQESSLRKQKVTKDRMGSQFSYFELMYSLNFGFIQRFLPVYEYGVVGEKYELQVTSMVLWAEKTGDPCRKTKSLVTHVHPNGTFSVMKKLQGKMFPFSLSSEWENVVGFYVHAEHTRRCLGNIRRIVVRTLFSSSEPETNLIEGPINSTLQEAVLMEAHEIFLLLAFTREGNSSRIFIYRFDSINGNWTINQEFYNQDFSSLDWTAVEIRGKFNALPDYYLAVAGDNSNPGVAIYKWNFVEDKFALKTNFSTSVSSYVLWVQGNNLLALLLAKEMTRARKELAWVNYYNEPLDVYSIKGDDVSLNHTVQVRGVRYLETFVLGGEVFVIASSHHMNTVYLLQLRGYNGFEVIQEIPSSAVTSTSLFTVENDLYLAISSSSGPSKVLKAAIHGGRQMSD